MNANGYANIDIFVGNAHILAFCVNTKRYARNTQLCQKFAIAEINLMSSEFARTHRKYDGNLGKICGMGFYFY